MRRRSYAIWWSEDEGPRHAGKLEVGALHVLVSGSGGGRLAISFDEIVTIDYARGELELTRRHRAPIRVGNLDGPGALLELVDVLKLAA
jgi:hypothetical protein